MPTTQARVFVGSSTEGLPVAKAIQQNLGQRHEVTIWNQGVFRLGHNTLESLENLLADFDFAVLALTADDVVTSRGLTQSAPRDNILFEMGLFTGVLGSKRTFAVIERTSGFKLPSDLAGITVATYELHTSGNVQASLGAACTDIENQIDERGCRNVVDLHRLAENKSEKESIASAICTLDCIHSIQKTVGTDHMAVAFGPGSTPFYVAKRLMTEFRLHVITDNMLIIKHICDSSAILNRLTVMGGEWDPNNQSFGWARRKSLTYNPELTIIGCAGIAAKNNSLLLTCYSQQHKHVLTALVQWASQRAHQQQGVPSLVIAADHSKLRVATKYDFATSDDLPRDQTVLVSYNNGSLTKCFGTDEMLDFIRRTDAT